MNAYAKLLSALTEATGAVDYSRDSPELISLAAGYLFGLDAAKRYPDLASSALNELGGVPLSGTAQRLILEFITKEDTDESV